MSYQDALPNTAEPLASEDEAREFETLLLPVFSGAYGLAFSMLGKREDAEDVVQEAAVKAWRGFRRLRSGAAFRPWFFAIVANQCRDLRRSPRRAILSLFGVPEPKVADPSDDIARDLDLERALARLSPNQRGLLFLRYQMDMSPAEISAVLGWRAGTVKSRLFRALRRLEADMVVPTEENR